MTKNILAEFPDDTFLLESFLTEDKKHYAFNLIVRKYQERIYWHIRKMVVDHNDADDLTQEVFLKVWTKLADFRGQSSLFTWLYRVATNECLNFLRKKRRKFMLPLHDVAKELSEKIEHGAYVSGSTVEKELQKALLKLPDKQRVVFNMKYFEDMPYKEISEILQVSIGGLKASYHLAVKKVCNYIAIENI